MRILSSLLKHCHAPTRESYFKWIRFHCMKFDSFSLTLESSKHSAHSQNKYLFVTKIAFFMMKESHEEQEMVKSPKATDKHKINFHISLVDLIAI